MAQTEKADADDRLVEVQIERVRLGSRLQNNLVEHEKVVESRRDVHR
jgi:hypothetical protein